MKIIFFKHMRLFSLGETSLVLNGGCELMGRDNSASLASQCQMQIHGPSYLSESNVGAETDADDGRGFIFAPGGSTWLQAVINVTSERLDRLLLWVPQMYRNGTSQFSATASFMPVDENSGTISSWPEAPHEVSDFQLNYAVEEAPYHKDAR